MAAVWCVSQISMFDRLHPLAQPLCHTLNLLPHCQLRSPEGLCAAPAPCLALCPSEPPPPPGVAWVWLGAPGGALPSSRWAQGLHPSMQHLVGITLLNTSPPAFGDEAALGPVCCSPPGAGFSSSLPTAVHSYPSTPPGTGSAEPPEVPRPGPQPRLPTGAPSDLLEGQSTQARSLLPHDPTGPCLPSALTQAGTAPVPVAECEGVASSPPLPAWLQVSGLCPPLHSSGPRPPAPSLCPQPFCLLFLHSPPRPVSSTWHPEPDQHPLTLSHSSVSVFLVHRSCTSLRARAGMRHPEVTTCAGKQQAQGWAVLA